VPALSVVIRAFFGVLALFALLRVSAQGSMIGNELLIAMSVSCNTGR